VIASQQTNAASAMNSRLVIVSFLSARRFARFP
jgi:hypothetical protein